MVRSTHWIVTSALSYARHDACQVRNLLWIRGDSRLILYLMRSSWIPSTQRDVLVTLRVSDTTLLEELSSLFVHLFHYFITFNVKYVIRHVYS